MHTDPPKNHDMRNRRMRVCNSLLKLQNEIMRIYLSLAIRPQKHGTIIRTRIICKKILL